MRLNFTTLFAVFFFLYFPLSSDAQKKPTKEIPQYVSNIEGIKEYRLVNGLQVLLVPDPTQSNMIINIVYRVGSRNEGYGESGMAHLLEHMLFKSTKNLGDIKKMLSDKGGNANGTTWDDRTNYYEIFPSSEENLKWALQMEADRMVNATILQSDLDKEFSVVRNEFEIGENDPESILQERILSTAYLWHNYGKSTIGSKEDIERVKASRLRLFYEKYYQPDNATLIVAGKFNEAQAIQYIGEFFTIIPKPNRVLEQPYTVEPSQDGERFVELRRSGDVQYLGAAYHTCALADSDFAPMSVLLNILDNNPSGYLYKSLVETQIGSAIYCYQQPLHDPSYAYFSFEVPKDKSLDIARKAFLDALDNISKTTYTEADLKRGKAGRIKSIENTTNNTVMLAIQLTEYIGAGDYRLWFLNRDRMEKVTLQDIQRVAEKYFRTNNRTWGEFIPTDNEQRTKPEEFTDERIQQLLKNYQGREIITSDSSFENTISNIKAHTTEVKLDNGFHYSFVKKPIKGGKVLASILIPVGEEKSLQGKAITASLMADLLKAGTKNMTKEQIHDKLDELKSSINFKWYGQTLNISISSYEKELPEVMNILKQCLTESVFPENELIKTKTENNAYLSSQIKDPQNIAFITLDKKISNYPAGHFLYTYSPAEEIEEQNKVTRLQILDFFNKFMAANHGLGTIIGNLPAEEVNKMMKDVFGGWTNTTPFIRYKPSYYPSNSCYERINTPDKENAAVMCGVNIKISQQDADYPALMMANEMLGSGGFLTSRIPTRLREKEGISYGAGSYLSVSKDNDDAQWGVYAFFNPSAVNRVDTALQDEIIKAVTLGFTADELKQSIISWKNERKTSLGYDGVILSLINESMKTNIPIDSFDELEKKVNALTVDQVNATLKKYIDTKKMCYVFAGDFDKKK